MPRERIEIKRTIKKRDINKAKTLQEKQKIKIAEQRFLISQFPLRIKKFYEMNEKFEGIKVLNKKSNKPFYAEFLKAMNEVIASGDALANGLKERDAKVEAGEARARAKAETERLRKQLKELIRRRNLFVKYIKKTYPDFDFKK